jgi:hypothetical protein
MALDISTGGVLADKCDKNDNGNCNNVEKDQKVTAKNDCNIKNDNNDKGHDNTNINSEDGLTCSTDTSNQNGVGLDSVESDSNSLEQVETSSVGNKSNSLPDTQVQIQPQVGTHTFSLPVKYTQ